MINKKASSRAMSLAFVILIVSVLAGVAFGGDGLASSNLTSNAPAWVVTLLTVGAGIGFARLVMR